MTQNKKNIIENILGNIFFSDNSSVYSRASDLILKSNNIGFSIDISGLELKESESVRGQVVKAINNLKKYDNISVILTSDASDKKNTKGHKKEGKIHVDGVKKVIMVASGKGGVGKSTIATLLAHKLSNEGKKVGLLDADIYGPSIPKMFNLSGKPKLDNNKMVPHEKYGIKVNSIGFITQEEAAISWRGPMVSKAIYQLMSLTKWDDLDCLIIDSPPGTGDIHLSLLQSYNIDEIIMVTTPQQIAKIDVARAINLYNKFDVPITGIIENMSYYIDAEGKKIQIFSGNGANDISKQYNILVIAKLPILPDLSNLCDKGDDVAEYSKRLDF